MQCCDEKGRLHRMILCRRDIDGMRHLPEDQWDITIAGLPVYWMFPNVIIMPFRFGCFLVRAYPVQGDPGRHVSRVDFYMKSELANAEGDEAAAVNELSSNVAQTFAEVIRDEDYAMGESQQTSANAGVIDRIVFGRNEPALHHDHRTYAAKLAMPARVRIDQVTVAADSGVPIGRCGRRRCRRPTPTG